MLVIDGVKIVLFQLTTSRRGRQFRLLILNIIAIFQLTTSRRGRRVQNGAGINSGELSTHDLTQRSTHSPPLYMSRGIFQLTTSRRGRRCGWNDGHTNINPFNSRPHAEVDVLRLLEGLAAFPFNSRPHAEGDCRGNQCTDERSSFNSRPHAEVDINISHILCKISILFLIFFTKTTLNKAQKYEYYFIFAKINC